MVKRDLYLGKYNLNEFKINLLENDKAASTCNLYLDNIIQFIEWFISTEEIEFEEDKVTAIDIRDFRSYLQSKKNEKPGSINTKIASLKKYFKFLFETGLINKDPAESIKKIRVANPNEVKSFSEKTYHSLRREIYRQGNPLHIAIWEVLTRTGCRCSELCNLKLNSIRITERTARIQINGKGNKIRELKLHVDAKNALLEYLKIRNNINVTSNYLFISTRKQKFTRTAIWKILNKYAARVGTHISVHSCRHYFCRSLLKRGVDLATVSRIAGHSSTLTTAKFYEIASQEEMDDAIDKL
jgi:integrase/recombinase XerD